VVIRVGLPRLLLGHGGPVIGFMMQKRRVSRGGASRILGAVAADHYRSEMAQDPEEWPPALEAKAVLDQSPGCGEFLAIGKGRRSSVRLQIPGSWLSGLSAGLHQCWVVGV